MSDSDLIGGTPVDPGLRAEGEQQTGSPGARLLAERRSQGLSLGDIARQLKLSVRQVEALERDEYTAFSGPVFVRGFLRNYAKLLHLDPDPLLEAANLAVAAPVGQVVHPAAAAPPASARSEHGRRLLVGAALTLLVVIAVGLLASNAARERRKPGPIASEPSATLETPAPRSERADSPPPVSSASSPPPPAPAQEAVPAPPLAEPPAKAMTASSPAGKAPAASRVAPAAAARPEQPADTASRGSSSDAGMAQIRLVFEGESWVEIKDGSGATIYSRLNPEGTERVVRGVPPFSLVIGNAHGVKLTYRDRAVDLEPHTRVDVARITLE
ncbi:MAG TPA: helix-turn-helix domain-containing protein [Burkholderiales bacterium]|nr:helix-turn-helix domain-containing protein [Burkholderiales bacterium]